MPPSPGGSVHLDRKVGPAGAEGEHGEEAGKGARHDRPAWGYRSTPGIAHPVEATDGPRNAAPGPNGQMTLGYGPATLYLFQ